MFPKFSSEAPHNRGFPVRWFLFLLCPLTRIKGGVAGHVPASHLIMLGASMKAVQEHLNHSSPTMTNRYAHISEKFQKVQVELLNGLCGESDSKNLVRNEELNKNELQPTVQPIA